MKATAKKLTSRLVSHDRAWRLLDRSVLTFARYAEQERKRREPSPRALAVSAAIKAIVPDLVVRNGPFKGLRYSEATATGGSLFPKLLGSYERELQPVVEQLCANAYTDVIDVGCAEGYYAVGLARRLPDARVHAYDIDARALSLCRTMADLNGVGDRLIVSNDATPATLTALMIKGRALVLSDCEGYERPLFTPDVVRHFARHDLLIEVHDFLDIHASSQIRARFKATHDLTVIESTDDVRKAQTYVYDELEGYDIETRKLLLAELRPATMEWFYFTPRHP